MCSHDRAANLNSRAVVISYGGEIWRVPTDGSPAAKIPFTVNAEVPVGPAVTFEYPVEDPELALPEGFQYRVIGAQGSAMSDGRPAPPLHDGMAAFSLPNGNIRLIRNHRWGTRPPAGLRSATQRWRTIRWQEAVPRRSRSTR